MYRYLDVALFSRERLASIRWTHVGLVPLSSVFIFSFFPSPSPYFVQPLVCRGVPVWRSFGSSINIVGGDFSLEIIQKKTIEIS